MYLPHEHTMCTHPPTDVSNRFQRDPSHFVVMRRFILLLLLATPLCSGYQVYIDSTDLEEYFTGTLHFSDVQGKVAINIVQRFVCENSTYLSGYVLLLFRFHKIVRAVNVSKCAELLNWHDQSMLVNILSL